MGMFKGFSIDDMIARGNISDADVMKMRSATYADGKIDAAEADALFALDGAKIAQARAWSDFFIEAITDYLVNQVEPYGYVTAENAQWLIERVDVAGQIGSRSRLELVVHAVDRARWAPESLVRYALQQVRHAVLTGSGVLRAGTGLAPGMIAETDIELLRRILYAFGGDGNVAVTRAEAEVLFEINDAVSAGPVNPQWTDLFVKAITSVVMASSSYAAPTREEALRREAWLDQHTDLTPLGIMRGIMANGGLLTGYRALTREESALDRLERQRIEMIVNEEITEGEATWLAERIGRDGRLNANEAALIAYLKKESPKLHPSLNELLARLAPAA